MYDYYLFKLEEAGKTETSKNVPLTVTRIMCYIS